MWVRDPSAVVVIEEAWKKGSEPSNVSNIMSKFKHTKLALKDWNLKVFGHIQSSIKYLKYQIETLQNLPQTQLHSLFENKAQLDLDELLLRERIL